MTIKDDGRRVRFAARLRYAFDTSMSADPIALMGWLAILSVVVIVVAGLVLAFTGIAPDGPERMGFVEAL